MRSCLHKHYSTKRNIPAFPKKRVYRGDLSRHEQNEPPPWFWAQVGEQTGEVQVQGRARHGKRLRKLLERLSDNIGGRPCACQDWANTKAAYRILSNSRVRLTSTRFWQDIFKPRA